MHRAPPLARKTARWAPTLVESVVVGTVTGILFVRLSNMQLDGLLTFGAGAIALTVAITSLMFNRARAYPDGPLQRRTLLAAELSLRSTLSLAIGAVLTAMIFPFVQAVGYQPTPMDKFPTQAVPIVCALIPVPFVLAGSLLLLQTARVIGPSMFTFLRATHVKAAVRRAK